MTIQIAVMLALLAFATFLFVSELVRNDVAAMLVLALLGVLSITPGLEEAVSAKTLFSGFASDAVIAIIAVMIIGAGLDRTGVMNRLAAWIVDIGRHRDGPILSLLCGTAGLVSAFVQNIGVIALFLPVASRISARTNVAMSRLLIPVGFCTILGGTITLVGCSPLIMLNELIRHANQMLPPQDAMARFGLFAPAPVGLALLAAGIVFFLLAGRHVLPEVRGDQSGIATRTLDYFKRVYGFDPSIHEVVIPTNSPLIGTSIDEVQQRYRVRIAATHFQGKNRLSPPTSVEVDAPAVLAVIADAATVKRFAEKNGLVVRSRLQTFTETLLHTRCGIAELLIPPDSSLIGKTARELRMRTTYQLTLLAIHRAGESLDTNQREIPFQAGDSLVCHTTWEALARLEKNHDFVVVTSEYPHEEERPQKILSALLFFLLSLTLALYTEMRLGAAMLIGAVGMVLSGVLSMDEAYDAVSWKTVFLLAGLMPLGQAVQSSGTAAWIASQTLAAFGAMPEWVLQAVLALMAGLFSLVMSNVGATILLVPIAVSIAVHSGANPGMYALIVALGTSNSFLIPTNQVNALIMAPAGYRSADFVRAGGAMTAIFIVVSLVVLNLLY